MSFRKRNSHTKSKRADSTKIHVVVRVRPRIAEDLDSTIHKRPGASAYEECVEEDEARSSVFLKKPYFDTREFAFDCVLGRGATQAQAYEAVARGVVDDVMAGFNGTILAYGQTGTGKTHTIYGPLSYWRRPGRTSWIEPSASAAGSARAAQLQEGGLLPQLELSGIVTRAALQIFATVDERRAADAARSMQFAVSLSSLQIYQESTSDLLADPAHSPPLQVREDPAHGVYVEGLSEHPVTSPEHVLELVHESATNRATCSTSMNRASSRSHALLLLRVEQANLPPDEPPPDDDASNGVSAASEATTALAVRRAVLSIVDLAGSERVCKSGSEGTRLDEAKRINKSIAALGNCIAALASAPASGRHVPFRDSKLTRLLMSSLGGNTKTALCVTVGPALHNYDETFCTLLLATRAMAVKNYARVNERLERPRGDGMGDHEQKALYKQMQALQSEVDRLRRKENEALPREALPRAMPRAVTPATSDGGTSDFSSYQDLADHGLGAPTPMPHAAVAALQAAGRAASFPRSASHSRSASATSSPSMARHSSSELPRPHSAASLASLTQAAREHVPAWSEVAWFPGEQAAAAAQRQQQQQIYEQQQQQQAEQAVQQLASLSSSRPPSLAPSPLVGRPPADWPAAAAPPASPAVSTADFDAAVAAASAAAVAPPAPPPPTLPPPRPPPPRRRARARRRPRRRRTTRASCSSGSRAGATARRRATLC